MSAQLHAQTWKIKPKQVGNAPGLGYYLKSTSTGIGQWVLENNATVASSNMINTPAAVGWITIATNGNGTGDPATGGGSRASAKFTIVNTTGGQHQSTTFYATANYGYATINIVNSGSWNPSLTFSAIRILTNSTYGGAELQVYHNSASASSLQVFMEDNFQTYGWTLLTTPSSTQVIPLLTEQTNLSIPFGSAGRKGGLATDGSITTNLGNYFSPATDHTFLDMSGNGANVNAGTFRTGTLSIQSLPDGVGSNFTPTINAQSTTVAGISVSTGGTNNRRAGLYMDEVNGIFGLSTIYSSGATPSFRLGAVTTKWLGIQGTTGISNATGDFVTIDVNNDLRRRTAAQVLGDIQAFGSTINTPPLNNVSFPDLNAVTGGNAFYAGSPTNKPSWFGNGGVVNLRRSDGWGGQLIVGNTGDAFGWRGIDNTGAGTWHQGASRDWVTANYATSSSIGNGTLTLATSGIATGSQTFTANQSGNSTFTVNVPATNLSTSANAGEVVSSTGTNTTLTNISRSIFTDANTIPASVGFYPYANTTGSLNYPYATGAGIRVVRNGVSSSIGDFDIWKYTVNDGVLRYRVGTTGTAYGSWEVFAAQSWVTTQLGSYVSTTRQVTAGTGMTGGGALSADVTLNAQTTTALWNANKLQGFDVATTTPTNGQILTYSTGTSKWEIVTPPAFITLTSLSGTSPITYNTGTGAIGITQATTSTNGYLTSGDWTTFNSKENALTFATGLNRSGNTITALVGSALWNANKIQGINVSATTPTTNQILQYDGTQYRPSTPPWTTNTGTVTNISAGNGMNFSTITTTGPVTLGTPSSITLSSTNSVSSTSHTHAFAPGGSSNQVLRGDGSLSTNGNAGQYYRGDGSWATMPTINQGSYSPTYTVTAGIGGTPTDYTNWFYTQQGKIVNVYGAFQFDEINDYCSEVLISLPVASSVAEDYINLTGHGTYKECNDGLPIWGVTVVGGEGNVAKVSWRNNDNTGKGVIFISFMYITE